MANWKRRFRWLGILSGALAVLLLLLGAGYYWMMNRPLAKRLAELRAAGEPLCLADLKPESIPPEQNGALYLLQAEKDVDTVEQAIYALKSNPDGSYPPEEMEKIHAILAAHPKIYPLLQQAASAPDFQFSRDYGVKPSQFTANALPFVSKKKDFVRYLKNCADDLLNEGKREESLEAAIVMLRLTRQYERDATVLVDCLMNVACKGIALESSHRVLQSGPMDEKRRAAFDAELAFHDSLNSCRAALKGEVAFCLDSMQNDMPPLLPTARWQHTALDMFEEYLQYSTQPYSAWVSKANKPPPGMVGLNLNGPASTLLAPSLQAFLKSAYRCQTFVRALRIINALQKKALPEDGPIPSMAELGLPKETGIDPFSGKPLIIKRLPEGWLVYGVGQNLTDDGGAFDKNLDVGFGPEILKVEKEKQEETPVEKP